VQAIRVQLHENVSHIFTGMQDLQQTLKVDVIIEEKKRKPSPEKTNIELIGMFLDPKNELYK